MPASLPHMILDHIADPVFVKDQEHRWTYVNQAFCDLMEADAEELLGKSDFDFFPPSEATVFWEKDEEVLRTRTTNVNQELMTVGSGHTRTIITKKQVFDGPDGPLLVGIIRDVTALTHANAALQAMRDTLENRVDQRTKQVQEALQQLHQAERLSTLGSLAGGIAHDFNNLLSIILLTNEDLAQRADVPADIRTRLHHSTSAALNAGKLTRSLLDYAAARPPEAQTTDIAVLVDRTVAMLGSTLGSGITLQVHRHGGPWFSRIDPSQLSSALVNLCVNARDAMAEEGAIHITISTDHRLVHLVVEDSGDGIEAAHLPKVFEPFFSTKGPRDGTGLGLSMVRRFIDQSAGTITIESERGRGTRVEMALPRCQNPVDPDPPPYT